MGYRLGNKEIKLNGKRMSKIATGKTGDVYRYHNMALKIFRKPDTPMSVETAEYLTGISTNRVLLPRKLLFYNHAFKGYSYTLVPKKGHAKKMLTLPKGEFLENIILLEKDIERLSRRNVLLNGVNPSNTIFNGRLYMIDPSKYTVLDMCPTEELETLNKYQLHLLLTTLITSDIRKSSDLSNYERLVRKLLSEKEDNEDSSDFFDSVIGKNDNVKEYVKSL